MILNQGLGIVPYQYSLMWIPLSHLFHIYRNGCPGLYDKKWQSYNLNADDQTLNPELLTNTSAPIKRYTRKETVLKAPQR